MPALLVADILVRIVDALVQIERRVVLMRGSFVGPRGWRCRVTRGRRRVPVERVPGRRFAQTGPRARSEQSACE